MYLLHTCDCRPVANGFHLSGTLLTGLLTPLNGFLKACPQTGVATVCCMKLPDPIPITTIRPTTLKAIKRSLRDRRRVGLAKLPDSPAKPCKANICY